MATENDRLILNCIFNPNLPLGEPPFDQQQHYTDAEEEAASESVLEAKRLECEGVKYAESGHLDEAIQAFSQAIQLAPDRPSGYNNRAQAFRIKGDNQSAVDDLNVALELSGGKGETAGKAYCQRGLLHQLFNEREKALADYESAAQLGSAFARSMAVQLNPYAALCNQMLAEVIKKLQQPL